MNIKDKTKYRALPRYNKLGKVILVAAISGVLAFTAAGCAVGSNSSDSTTSTTSDSQTLDAASMFTDRDLDASYDASSPTITLSDSGSTSSSSDVNISGNIITITAGGTYIISGSSSDVQIVIDVGEDKVQLVLDNATLTSSQAAAIYAKNADKVFITLADGTTNSISTASEAQSQDDNNIDGAVYAKCDLTINGNGTLNVTSTSTNGIVCKDDLRLVSGSINVTAGKHGVDANDSVRINTATINITATKKGIHIENEDDSSKGFLFGGNGSITITSEDDSINATGTVQIQDGTYTLSTGDDGIHSDSTLDINGGAVTVTKSNEGLEAQVINVNGGDTNVTSSDDGLNASSGSSNSSNDPMASDNSAVLNITGGKLRVNASGDGLDSNGAINISGGETYVSGPTNDGNTAVDCGSEVVVTGGTLVATGSSGMVETFSDKSTQGVIMTNASANEGTVKVTDSSGNTVVEYTPEKTYSAVIVSSPSLEVGQTYKVYCGDSSADFELSSTVTSDVTGGMGGGRGGMGGGQMPSGDSNGQDSQQMTAPTDSNGQQMTPPTDSNGNMQTPPDMNSSGGKQMTKPDGNSQGGGQMKGKSSKQNSSSSSN